MASLDSKPATVAAAQRFNIYQSVHKGLRAMLCDMLQAIGNCDLHEPAPRQHTLTRLHQELSLFFRHFKAFAEVVHILDPGPIHDGQ